MSAWHTGKEGLQKAGFIGFQTFAQLRENNLCDVPREHGDIGVYALLWPTAHTPTFLHTNKRGVFRGKDRSVSVDTLRKKWTPNSPVLYVGKAGNQGGQTTLRKRIKAYLDYGDGKQARHTGGEYVWQIEESDTIVVCWKRTAGKAPREIERQLVAEFKDACKALPFANRQS